VSEIDHYMEKRSRLAGEVKQWKANHDQQVELKRKADARANRYRELLLRTIDELQATAGRLTAGSPSEVAAHLCGVADTLRTGLSNTSEEH